MVSSFNSFPITKRVPNFTALVCICKIGFYERSSVWIRTVCFKFCATSRLWFKVLNALNRSIILFRSTPILFPSFSCVFQFSIIFSSAYCVMWFFWKTASDFENFISINSFTWLCFNLSKTHFYLLL